MPIRYALFYFCLEKQRICDNSLIACCSICFMYSTFKYGKSGVFEDFYIQPEYRHKGIARKLVAYAYEQRESRIQSVRAMENLNWTPKKIW